MRDAWSRIGELVFYLYTVVADLFIILLMATVCMTAWYFRSSFKPSPPASSDEYVMMPGWQKHDRSTGAPSDSYYELVEAPNGDVWARTDVGLCQFRADHWKCYGDFNNRLFYKDRFGLAVDENGEVWTTISVGEADQFGLWKLDGNRFVRVSEGAFREVCRALGGGVWTYDEFGSKQIIRYSDKETVIELEDWFSGDLVMDVEGTLWLFDGDSYGRVTNGLTRAFFPDDVETIDYPGAGEIAVSSSNIFFSHVNDRKAYVWSEGGRWQEYDSIWLALQARKEELSSPSAEGPYNNSLWAETRNGTILCKNKMLRDHEWELIQQISHLTPLQVSSVLVRKNNEIWIGTIGEGIYAGKSEDNL